ncbi:MAG TPA: PEP-CTERM sorting domain-containing protein [Bryobacteraceae bacterium]|nr:PEP-CTERM sorting domain-containing protein [Bryobacteraceae bacterium]
MPVVKHLIGVFLLLTMALQPSLNGAEFFDIPGEGNLRCFPAATCPDSRGTVVSVPSGSVTGDLSGSLPTLAVSLTTNPLFLNFSGGGTPLGPLGLNPEYDPQSLRDSRIPVSGQRIALDLTNDTGATFSDVAFYLLIPATVITEPFPSQPDGLSFGVWCNTTLDEPRDCGNNLALLAPPTGPGSVNPFDLTPAAGPGTTFGDLLRFRQVNLAPGDTAQFTFFITDRTGTLDPSTGGSPTGANASFHLEIVATAVPEPSTVILTVAGLLAIAIRARRVRR